MRDRTLLSFLFTCGALYSGLNACSRPTMTVERVYQQMAVAGCPMRPEDLRELVHVHAETPEVEWSRCLWAGGTARACLVPCALDAQTPHE